MANIVSVKWKDFLQSEGSNVKQAAVKIKIPEVEERLISESANIIADDQSAVMLLHFLVVGDRVIAKGRRDKSDERDEKRGYGKIITIDTCQSSDPSTPSQGRRRFTERGGEQRGAFRIQYSFERHHNFDPQDSPFNRPQTRSRAETVSWYRKVRKLSEAVASVSFDKHSRCSSQNVQAIRPSLYNSQIFRILYQTPMPRVSS